MNRTQFQELMQESEPTLLGALAHCMNHLEQIAKRDYPNSSPEMRKFTSVMHAEMAIAAHEKVASDRRMAEMGGSR